ncbi:hypothetical protein TNCV_428601 [Trichonephila clavipes]|nr:hypothetical protein TNCV_428601 [Trichonephila clavipes]
MNRMAEMASSHYMNHLSMAIVVSCVLDCSQIVDKDISKTVSDNPPIILFLRFAVAVSYLFITLFTLYGYSSPILDNTVELLHQSV